MSSVFLKTASSVLLFAANAVSSAAVITPGAGYFVPHAFSTMTGNPPTSGQLGGQRNMGPTFTVTGSGGVTHVSATFPPGSGAVAPVTPMPVMDEISATANSAQFVTYQFASAVPVNTHVYLQDVDSAETMRLTFFDCAGAVVNPSTWDQVNISTSNLPNVTFGAGFVTVTATTAINVNEPLIAIVIKSANVCSVRATNVAATGGTTYEVFFSMPAAKITLQKALGGNRITAADQFRLNLNATNSNSLAATTGTGSVITSAAVTGPVVGGFETYQLPGGIFTLTEQMAVGSASAISSYTQSISCTAAALPGGTSGMVNIGVRTLPTGAGTLSGGVVSYTIVPGPWDNITCSIINTPVPRLTVTKTASANPLVVGVSGQSYTININVANIPTTTPTITLTDILPTGITLSGIPTATGGTMTGCPSSGNTLAGCSIAAGAPVGNILITVPVAVGATAPSSVINTATVAGGGDPACTGTAPACSGSVTTATLATAALLITKTDNKVIATSGTTNDYVVTLTNQGPSPADGSVLTDAAVAGLTCPAANQVTCTVIAAGAVCPSPITLGNLTGVGVIIATLPANGALQFTYTCNVN